MKLRVVWVGKIQGLYHVAVRHGGATRDHEQGGLATDVLDHEGLTLMAAQSVGALQPDHLQLAHVTGSNVGQRAVAGKCKVTTGGGPLVRILHPGQLLLVGASQGRTRHAHHQGDEPAGYDTKLEVVHFLLLSLAYSVHRLS